jgi:hypothetical protein
MTLRVKQEKISKKKEGKREGSKNIGEALDAEEDGVDRAGRLRAVGVWGLQPTESIERGSTPLRSDPIPSQSHAQHELSPHGP